MLSPEDARKRLPIRSPEKQPGVRAHDKKRRNTIISTSSDMDESGTEEPNNPTPPQKAPTLAHQTDGTPKQWNQDREGDTTMVDSSQGSPSPSSSPSPKGSGPAQRAGPKNRMEDDSPWAERRAWTPIPSTPFRESTPRSNQQISLQSVETEHPPYYRQHPDAAAPRRPGQNPNPRRRLPHHPPLYPTVVQPPPRPENPLCPVPRPQALDP